ncbi:hypothetical protein RU639_007092 [Aspergillus parasiticus]
MPEGWTNDPKQLETFFYPESGEMQYIIKSGGRYYWGDLMIDYIFEITKPKTFPAILRALAINGDIGLKYRKLKQVEEFEIESREQRVVEEEEEDLFVPYNPDAPSESDK